MAITKDTRTDLIELAVIANNASPGTTLLAELIAHVEAGKTLVEIGDALAARSEFKATYPAIQTADEFAKEYVGNLLPEASAELAAECETIVAAHVNAGKGLGELFVAIHGVLDTDTSAALATHVANYKNKASVAEYHTVTLETASESSSVLASVTSAVTSVATGKAAADGPAPVAAPTASFALSANASAVNEGEAAVFTLDTTNVAAGSEYSWTVAGVNGSDLTGGTSGTTKIGADGKAIVSLETAADTTTEGAETMTLSVAGQTASTTVNDTSVTPPPANQVHTLTAAANTITDNAGNGTFVGLPTTLSVGDVLDGGEGTDTMSLTANLTAAAASAGFTTTGIENFNISAADGNAAAAHVLSVNMLNSSPTTITISGASSATQDSVTLTNVDSSSQLTLSGLANTDINYTYDAAWLAGTGDAATLTVTGVTSGATGDATVTYGAGLETLNIVSSGTASTLGAVGNPGSTLNVSGDAKLTVRAALAAGVTTLNAADSTGGISISTGNPADSGVDAAGIDQADQTITGSSAADTLNVAAIDANDEVSVSAGAGNDSVTIGDALTGAAAATVGDKIDGGDGTDTIVMTTALAQGATTSTHTGVSGFEALQISDAHTGGTITVARAQATAISTVTLADGTNSFSGGNGVITFAAGASTLNLVMPGTGGALTLNDTGTGLTDSITINNASTAASPQDVFAAQNLAVNGIETVTFNASVTGDVAQDFGTITMTSDIGTGATDTINFAGADRVTVQAITAEVINASGLTAAQTGTTFNMGAAAVGVTSITGSAGADILVGDAKSTINGGAGNDNITGGTGNDTLSGEAGNDIIATDTGVDIIDGGAGNDVINFAGNLTTADKVAGGDGTDTLSVLNASLTALQGQTISEANTFNTTFTGMERLLIGANMDSTGDSFDLGYLSGVNHVTVTTLAADAETIAGFGTGGSLVLLGALGQNLTATVNGAVAGASESLNVSLVNSGDVTYGTLALANIETMNIDLTEATASVNSRTGTLTLTATQTTVLGGGSGAAQTVNITGSEDIVFGAAVAAGTINASGMSARLATTPGMVMNSTGHSAAQTITGSSGADTIIGSTKTDTLTGGAGNDIIAGGLGADIIDGGTGTDTISTVNMVGGSGALESAGGGTSTGVVVNLGSTAATAATVLSKTATNDVLSGSLSTVAAGSIAYLFNASAPTNAATVKTVTGVENVTLAGNGENYVIGSDGANVIIGGSGADRIESGKGNDTVSPGLGIDTVALGAGSDTLSLTGIAVVANRVTVSDFNTTADIVGLDVDNTTVGTAAAATPIIEDEATAANNGNGITYDLGSLTATNTNAIDLVTLDTAVLTNLANADLSNSTTGVELLKALTQLGVGKTAASITLQNNGDKLYIATDDGVDGYLYLATTGANAIAQAAEILLVGTFSADADFGDIVAANVAMVA
jgi:Ca2+-binding RTX toxin-like protein